MSPHAAMLFGMNCHGPMFAEAYMTVMLLHELDRFVVRPRENPHHRQKKEVFAKLVSEADFQKKDHCKSTSYECEIPEIGSFAKGSQDYLFDVPCLALAPN
jgi:hypothetical protein